MRKYNYYESELTKLKTSEYYKSIQVLDGQGNTTKHLDLNIESIPVLLKFLSIELKRLSQKENKK